MIARLDPKVRDRIVVYEPTGCWIWTGAVTSAGYGNLHIGGRKDGYFVSAHRHVYETIVGPVPDGLDLDHLCRVRQCCNPEHLEPVTRRENLRRGGVLDFLRATSEARAKRTHCGRGHELSAENVRVYHGRRTCKACQRLNYRTRRSVAADAAAPTIP